VHAVFLSLEGQLLTTFIPDKDISRVRSYADEKTQYLQNETRPKDLPEYYASFLMLSVAVRIIATAEKDNEELDNFYKILPSLALSEYIKSQVARFAPKSEFEKFWNAVFQKL
jgi:hypothetical protein